MLSVTEANDDGSAGRHSNALTRLVVSHNSSHDLLISGLGQDIKFAGLYQRRHQETIQFQVPVNVASVQSDRDATLVDFEPCPEPLQAVNGSAVHLKGAAFGCSVELPDLTEGLEPGFVNLVLTGECENATFTFPNVVAARSGSDDDRDLHPILPDGASPPTRAWRVLTLHQRGSTHTIAIVFRFLSEVAGTLHLSGNDLHVSIRSTNLKDGLRIVIFSRPVPGERHILGAPTFSLAPAQINHLVFQPIRPRILSWLAAAIVPHENPLSILNIAPPRFPIPGVVYAGEMVEKPRILVNTGSQAQIDVYYGWFTDQTLDQFSQAQPHRVIVWINDDASEEQINIVNNPGWMKISLPSWRSEFVEEALSIVAALGMAGSPAAIPWTQQVMHRLPSLPVAHNLATNCSLLLTNLYRGRIPEDSGETHTETDWAAVFAPDRWLVPPLNDKPVLPLAAVFEISRRSVIEYTAIRAVHELMSGKEIPTESLELSAFPHHATVSRLADDEMTAVGALVERWMAWGMEEVTEKSEIRRQFTELIAGLALGPSAAAGVVARCLASLPGSRLRREQWTLIGTLVLVLFGGGDEVYDPEIELEAPGWVSLAGRGARSRPGCLVASLLPRLALAKVEAMQAELRLAFYASAGPERRDRIRKLRDDMNKELLDILDPAAYALPSALGADRVITVTDLPLQLVPFLGTVLCMEYAVTQIPLKIGGWGAINAVLAANRIDIRIPTEALIICPRNATDAQTVWARDIADSMARELPILGLRPVRFSDSQSPLPRTPSEAPPLVMFFGHATSTTYWSGLDLGGSQLSADAISSANWTGSVVMLFGCETGAMDTFNDLATAYLKGGALCVLGTVSKVTMDVANHFAIAFLQSIGNGQPVDYSFLHAQRSTVLFENFLHCNNSHEASARADSILLAGEGSSFTFHELLESEGIQWPTVMRNAEYSLSFRLYGLATSPLA